MSETTRQDRFLSLLDDHKRILYKVASCYCWNPDDRQDLVQEIVVQLWRSFGRYDETCRFSTWTYRIALNVAISYVRSEARRTRHTVPAEEWILDVPVVDAGATESEDLKLLHLFIARLGELDRALILLYLDGNPHETIAEVLGISQTNVGTRIGRIKDRLRRDVTQPV